MKFAVELLLLDFSACGSGSFLLDDCDDIHSVDTNLRIVCLSREVSVFFDTETKVSGCVELACMKDVLDRVGLQCNSKEVDCLLTAEGNLTADWLSAADTKCRKGVLSVGGRRSEAYHPRLSVTKAPILAQHWSLQRSRSQHRARATASLSLSPMARLTTRALLLQPRNQVFIYFVHSLWCLVCIG